MRANLKPGLVLQGFALFILGAYFYVPEARQVLNAIGRLKAEHGYVYSALSTAIAGGVVPFLVLWLSGRLAAKARLLQFCFLVLFWLWKGVEIDALYRVQGMLFGEQPTPGVIVAKAAVDQFLYNPLWGAPTQAFFFLWVDEGFSFEGVKTRLQKQSFVRRVLVILFSTWVVWVPTVAVVYALPSPLQIPLFNVVLCFWCLLLTFVSGEDRSV